MAKKSKLGKCVLCEKHHAIVGAFTSYYGVGYEGKKQIKGFIPSEGLLGHSSPAKARSW